MQLNGLFSLVALASLVAAGPTPRAPLRQLKKVDGDTTGRLIVTLKEGFTKSDVMGLSTAAAEEWSIIPGFVVDGSEETLENLLSHPGVESVEEDGMVHIMTTQTNAPWGLSRLSASGRLGSTNTGGVYPYTYDDSAGEGVDIYIIDTGIYTGHNDFGGRARWGATFGGYANADGNGHGTHCAGTAASSTYGVAKKANLIAVKVLSDSGSGSYASVISGVNYVAQQAAASGRPSVASMSLGGSASSSLDAAVSALISSGVHMAVAAGNSNTNAANTSPARVRTANTVGSTDITDARSYFSNYGSVVDIWAPGSSVRSTWIGSSSAVNTISGTSMATPHVAGMIAYLIGLEGNISPAAMTNKIQSNAQSGVISNIPSGTVNLFAHI